MHMKILTLQLENFRNYASQDFRFIDGLNVICGSNGAGKTNVLESVYLLSLFTSPRTTKDRDLVLFGKDKARVKMQLEKRFRKHTIILQIEANGKKKVVVDGIPVKRAAELIGVLGVVYFSPDEMRLVKETPAERRRFLDVGLSQQQRAYFTALSRYNKIIKQKNNLLKDSARLRNVDEMLSVWDAQLAEYGAIIIFKRKKYLEQLNSEAAKIHSILSGEKEKLELGYECPIDGETVEEIKEKLFEKIESTREKDKQLGFGTVGPHRDDISISVNGLDSRKFASQGQQRSVALAMKFGEAEMYREESGEAPVLLLDDVLSELDEQRQEKLLELTQGVQTLLTCTEFKSGQYNSIVKIENGKITEEK